MINFIEILRNYTVGETRDVLHYEKENFAWPNKDFKTIKRVNILYNDVV